MNVLPHKVDASALHTVLQYKRRFGMQYFARTHFYENTEWLAPRENSSYSTGRRLYVYGAVVALHPVLHGLNRIEANVKKPTSQSLEQAC